VQAAQAVTGKDSSQQLEEVLELQRLATDDAQDERVRQAAAEALVEINADGPVHGLFQNVKILQVLCWLERVSLDEDVASQVRDAAASEIEELRSVERRPERARAAGAAARRIADLLDRPAHPLSTDDSADADSADVDADANGPAGGMQVRGIYQARRLVDTFARVEGWWANHDPTLVGVHATEEQWRLIVEHRRRAAAFLDSAEAAPPPTPAPTTPPAQSAAPTQATPAAQTPPAQGGGATPPAPPRQDAAPVPPTPKTKE
jgi:ParB family chromosome partitioning protein